MPDPDPCGHPKEMLPNPPGSTPEQQQKNLEAYLQYLECLNNYPPGDCKGRDWCWREYTYAYAVIYPPNQ